MKKQLPKLFVLFVFVLLASVTKTQAYAATSRTTTLYTSSSSDGVNVIPYITPDRKGMYIDFDHFTNSMDYIYYNLNYTDRRRNILGGVEGSFITNPLPVSGMFGNMNYVRKHLVFGSCSGKVCTYGKPKNVTLTVNTHYANGKVSQVTRILKFPDDQF